MTSARPTFELVVKSVTMGTLDWDLPLAHPTAVWHLETLSCCRKKAAEVLLASRKHGYEVFSMEKIYEDPYQWCLTDGHTISFVSIRAQEPQT